MGCCHCTDPKLTIETLQPHSLETAESSNRQQFEYVKSMQVQGELIALQTHLTAVSFEKQTLEQHVAVVEKAHASCESIHSDLQQKIQSQSELISTLTSQLATLQSDFSAERTSYEQRLALPTPNAPGPRLRDCIKLTRSARLGLTGKYYCNKPIDGDEVCGPVAGSNCLSCQKLDIWARDLPPGFLVNNEGRIVRRGRDGSTWYCGSRVLQESETCDGWCGPSSGQQCTSCSFMQLLSQSRYLELIQT